MVRGRLRRQRVEPQVFSNPGVDQAARCESAKQSQEARAGTCRVSKPGARRAGSFEHDVSHDAPVVRALPGQVAQVRVLSWGSRVADSIEPANLRGQRT